MLSAHGMARLFLYVCQPDFFFFNVCIIVNQFKLVLLPKSDSLDGDYALYISVDLMFHVDLKQFPLLLGLAFLEFSFYVNKQSLKLL